MSMAMIESLGLLVVCVVYVAGAVWFIHKVIPGKWKNTVSFTITIATIIFQVPVKDQILEAFNQHNYNNREVVDSLKVSEGRILDSLRASEKKIMDLMQQTQAREGQLDSTIKTLQDSVHALQDSVNKHPDRHLHIIEAKLDALRSSLNARGKEDSPDKQ